MTVRAVWHTELVLDDDAADPFAEPEPQRVEDVGTPITISADGEQAQLQAALFDTVRREAELDAEGVRCAIKDVADASCHACPLYLDDGSPMARLCEIGREQERICTGIVVLRRGGRR